MKFTEERLKMREIEAKKKFWETVFEEFCGIHYKDILKMSYNGSAIDSFIQEIYEDFDSRICKNCKWYQNEVCVNDESLLCCEFTDEFFGCKLFKDRKVKDGDR